MKAAYATPSAAAPTSPTDKPAAPPAPAPLPPIALAEMPLAERPAERLRRYGPGPLSNAELIALLLPPGGGRRPPEPPLAAAQRLLAHGPGLASLNKASLNELQAATGLGPAPAGRLLAALELGRRAAAGPAADKPGIHSPEDAANLLQAEMAILEQEHFKVLLLDAKNKLTRLLTLYIGNLSSCTIRPAEVFKAAIRENACAVLAAHNHPSGDPTPSAQDQAITRKMAQAGELLGVELLDHIVIGAGNRFVSMKKRKLGFD